MYSPKEKVFWFSITTRLVVLALQCIFNALCPDHHADAFRSPVDSTEGISAADKVVEFLFNGLTRWDGQYFIHIAKHGYTYENTLAFYPLFPVIVRFIALILSKALPMLNYHSVVIIAAVLVNFVCFVKSAVIVYDLSVAVLKDRITAYKAAILYCINPASIFFSAVYSESMFAYLTFYSMLASYKNNLYAYLPLGIANIVRSNGLINIFFPMYFGLRNLLYLWFHKANGKQLANFYLPSVKIILSMLNTAILSAFPFVLLQVYNYMIFCIPKSDAAGVPHYVTEYGFNNDLILPGNRSAVWCEAKIPVAYSYIQDRYWNVGFMRYYKFKQIPNFIVATPMLFIMIACVKEFFYQHSKLLSTLGFYLPIENKNKVEKLKYPPSMLVFIIHGFFLTMFCIFFVHIQVSTRFLASASPLVYWHCALSLSYKSNAKGVCETDFEDVENLYSKWKVFILSSRMYYIQDRLIVGYFTGYMVIGCFMFSNFLPWT